MKVRATGEYEKLKVQDKEQGEILKSGKEFEVSEKRFEVLNGKNKYNAIFAVKVEEDETAIKKIKTEKAVRRNRKIKENDI